MTLVFTLVRLYLTLVKATKLVNDLLLTFTRENLAQKQPIKEPFKNKNARDTQQHLKVDLYEGAN